MPAYATPPDEVLGGDAPFFEVHVNDCAEVMLLLTNATAMIGVKKRVFMIIFLPNSCPEATVHAAKRV
jgi:hypothetical protein